MFEEQFMKLVEQYKGFEIVHAYRDDIDHFIGGKNDHFWYVSTKKGKVREAYVAFFKDGEFTDQHITGDGDKRKVKDEKAGTTIEMIAAKAYLCQDENWVKDRKGTLIEDDHPHIHFVKGFGDKALDVSKEFGVTMGYNDLDDTTGAFHMRDLSTGDKVEIFS